MGKEIITELFQIFETGMVNVSTLLWSAQAYPLISVFSEIK